MASATDTIRATIESQVSSLHTSTTIQWGDRPFTPPNGPWLRVSVRFGDAFPATIGGMNRLTGVVLLDLFDRANAGLGTIVQYHDTLRAGLALLETGGVRFGMPQGPREIIGDEFAHLSEAVPFEYWETA